MSDSRDSESIKSVIEGMQSRELVLPEFQRNFVWDIEKTLDLFDSLARDVFIGSLIYGVPSFEVSVREVDDRPRKGAGSRKKLAVTTIEHSEIQVQVKTRRFRLLLDGQQRLTSVYRAVLGVDSVWLVCRADLPDGKGSTLLDYLDEFSVSQSSGALSVSISDVWRMVTGEVKREADKEALFRSTEFGSGLNEESFSDAFGHYLTVSELLQDLLKADKLLSYYLLDTSLENFALFFERSNSRGKTLGFIDILAAKLYKGFNLRKHFEEFEALYPDVELSSEVLVRSVALLASSGREVKKPYILKVLTAEHFDDHWDDVAELFCRAVRWLRENRLIVSQREMPYEGMLIPLMMFLRGVPQSQFSQATEPQLEFVRYWYWASLFSQRYSLKTNETTVQDAALLGKIAAAKGGAPILPADYARRFKMQVQDVDDILEQSRTASAMFRSLLSVVNYSSGGFLDWTNASPITVSEKVDSHHIFPREYLRRSYVGDVDDREYVDSFSNRALIPKLTNIKIGKRAPSDYLQDLEGGHAGLKKSLGSHAIPADLISGQYDSSFGEFVRARAALVLGMVQGVTEKVADGAMAPYLAPK